MARPVGTRNADYEVSRARLLQALQPLLLSAAGPTASFRDLAGAAGVSTTTLRHYFGDRAGVLSAAYRTFEDEGLRYLAEVAIADHGPVEASLRWYVGYLYEGWAMGVGAIHRLGLAAGLVDPALGPEYLRRLLEPTIEAAEARLARHVANGELAPCTLRHAALELLSPVIVALLHQQALGGAETRPLAWDAFADDHIAAFLRAHAPR